MSNSSRPSAIKSEEHTVGRILSNRQPLRVPAYQRSFSWTKTEIQDLWDDLQNVLFSGLETYFLGSMVFVQKDDKSLEVVDGQQRLAALSLLIAAIRDGYKKAGDDQRASHVEQQYLCSRELRTMEASPTLSLNEVDNPLYARIIESTITHKDIIAASKNKDSLQSNRLLADAYVRLYEFIKNISQDFTKKEVLASLVEAVTDRVLCIQIVTLTEDAAYVLFETLNDRGVDLTLSDMLKNYLFSKAGTRLEEVKHKWTEVMTLIGQEYLKTYIRHEWMSRHGQIREKELYKKIKDEALSTPKAIECVTRLRESAVIYDAIRNPDQEIWIKLGVRVQMLLQELLLLGPIQCYPLILSTYLKKPRELETILDWIVSLSVRYSIIGEKGTGNLETTYAKASSTMWQGNSPSKDVKKILLNIWPNDEEFKTSFEQKTLSTPRIIKYILAKIERHLSKDSSLIPNPEILSVEHILPKNPGKKWESRMCKDDFISENVNRIGNLTILTEPMNRDCESKEFAIKKQKYMNSTYTLTKELVHFKKWDEHSITQRQAQLAKVAAMVWKL